MNKTLLTVLAAVGIAGAGVAVSLKSGECRDVIVVTKSETGFTKSLIRECEGEPSQIPDGAQVAWESPVASSKPLLSAAKTGAISLTEAIGGCACGPVTQSKDSPCMVTVTGIDGKTITRPALPGEHLYPGTYSGACPAKDCVETAARKYPGEATPVACGGVAKPDEIPTKESP